MEMSNIRNGSVWRHQTFLVASRQVALEETCLELFSKCNAPVDPSNVEDYHRLKVIMKLSKRKDVYRVLNAKPSLKNVDLNGTGIPPGSPIFVSQSLRRYYKFLLSKCKRLWLNNVVESFFSLEIQSLKKIQVVHKYEWYIILYI